MEINAAQNLLCSLLGARALTVMLPLSASHLNPFRHLLKCFHERPSLSKSWRNMSRWQKENLDLHLEGCRGRRGISLPLCSGFDCEERKHEDVAQRVERVSRVLCQMTQMLRTAYFRTRHPREDHNSLARSWTSFSFANIFSSVIPSAPTAVLAKPHCGLMPMFSIASSLVLP